MKATGVDLEADDTWRRNHLPELIAESPDSKFIVMQNIASPNDMKQLVALQEALGYSGDAWLGVRRLAPHVISWLYEGKRSVDDNPHSIQDWKTMFPAIDLLVDNFDVAEERESEYLVFSELWREHFQVEALLREKRHVKMADLDLSAVETTVEKAIVVKSDGVARYSYTAVHHAWEAGATYVVRTQLLDGTAGMYGILLRDCVSGEDAYRKDEVTSEDEFAFSVSGSCEGLAVLIYPNRIGECAGHVAEVKMSIEKVARS